MKNKRLLLAFIRFFIISFSLGTCINTQNPPPIVLAENASRYRKVPVQIILRDSTKMSANRFNTCAITLTGGIKCWGANTYGQIGDGTQVDRSTPVDVMSFENGISAISVGGYHVCALMNNGGVKCWGRNDYGQLGDGTNIQRNTPVDVMSLESGVSAISTGDLHTCALMNSGGVKCWGANYGGRLGDGTNIQRNTPVDVVGLGSGVSSVSAGLLHTCALMNTGGVKCWGGNSEGELGDGTMADKNIPIDVVSLESEVSSISAGFAHTCALMNTGGVKCWGSGYRGALGDGTQINRSTPVDVVGLGSGVSAISGGNSFNCVVMRSGGAKCWGWNDYGNLGDGTSISRSEPINVVGLGNGISSISAGGFHACALMNGGGVKCWGFNNYGNLGNGMAVSGHMKVDVVGFLGGTSAISSGAVHTCAVIGGGVKCWGFNSYGNIGDGTQIDRNTPVDVVGLGDGVSAIAAGSFHTCALLNSGGVKCWGRNANGSLGDGTNIQRNTPVDVVGLGSEVSAISASGFHTCALMNSGGVKCWGRNDHGELGDGTQSIDRSTPIDVIGLASEVSAIAAGDMNTCALMNSGSVKCWGDNTWGQVGDWTTILRNIPVIVSGLNSGTFLISTYGFHTCALIIGSAKCWGYNGYGGLGDGTQINRNTPVDVVSLGGNVSAISAGYHHTCALIATGEAKCWGYNKYGQLGDGTMIDELTPTNLVDLKSGMSAISLGEMHTCALMTVGGIRCWGSNRYGQLGDGTLTDRLSPVEVMIGQLDVLQNDLPIPLPRGCTGGGTPINYNNDTCCVKGFVYVDGVPVSGAAVAVNYNGQVVTGTTAVSSDSTQPYFGFSLNEAPLYVPVKGLFTITATYGGQSKSVSVTALAGSQQVDIALVGNSSQPIATINKITPLDAKQGAGNISFFGSGMDPDATDVIAQYEWKIINATTGFSVTNNAANFVISASSLTDVGAYTVTFRVQDDEGVWSGVVKQSLLVRNAQGGLTSGNTWTILIYADGDNNLGGSLGDAPGGMVRKLINLGSTPNVNVFGWYDGPKIGDSFEFQKYASGWFQKTALGEKRMDERGTLLNFITAGMNAFPSDHVMLILADHANGIVGIAQDLSSDGTGRAFITPIELRTAVQQATQDGTRKLDVVVFDGCSFGQFEDIATMDGLADYVVASPNTGWGVFPYDVYRSLASQSPAPAILAQQVAQTYATKVSSYQSLPYTIAAYDLSRFNQAKEAIGSLGNALVSYVNADPVTRRGQISALRGQAQKYDSFSGTYYAPDSEDNYVDIVDFAQLVGQNIADGDVVSAATAVSNVLSGGSQPLIIYKDDRSGIVSSWNSGYAGIGTIPVVFQRYNGLGIFYPPRTSGDPSSAYYNYITDQLFHITWNWGWTNFIANGIPPSLGGNEPPAMPGDLLISPLTPCGDVFEPNDLLGAASIIMVDAPITNLAFCQVGDEDWYVFTATAGAKYAIETYDLAQDTDTLLSLYNGAGAMLTSDGNGNSAVSSGGSRITMTLGSGQYYIKVNQVDANAGNPTLTYSLKVVLLQPARLIFIPSTMRESSAGW